MPGMRAREGYYQAVEEQRILDRRLIRTVILLEVVWLAMIFGAIGYGLFWLLS